MAKYVKLSSLKYGQRFVFKGRKTLYSLAGASGVFPSKRLYTSVKDRKAYISEGSKLVEPKS